MRKVELSGRSRQFLLRETAYLRQHSRRAAANFVQSIKGAQARLAKFPEIGFERQSPPVPGIRRLVVGAYILDYFPGETMTIANIRHGRQLDPESPVPDE